MPMSELSLGSQQQQFVIKVTKSDARKAIYNNLKNTVKVCTQHTVNN